MDDGVGDYFSDYEDPFENEDWVNQAWELANNSSINILSDKELLDFYIEPSSKTVVGAVFHSWGSDGEYSFDVVVDESNQGKGIGTSLTETAIDYFNSSADAYENPYMHIEVVNPAMQKILENHGFEVVEETPIGVNMRQKHASKGFFCSGPYVFVHSKPNVKYNKEVSLMSEMERLDKILSMLENRFRIRKRPHSLYRLEQILSEEDFSKYVIPDMFDKVVEALERKQRRFDKIKRKKRPSRRRAR